MNKPYRLVQISDLHAWRVPLCPFSWLGKRSLGLGNLLLRRARQFKRDAFPELVKTLQEDGADHLVISGDLTTTSLSSEFAMVKDYFQPWLLDRSTATVIPGNHDRYTRPAYRHKLFEQHFGEFCENGCFPFQKPLAPGLKLLGVDVSVPRLISSRGEVSSAVVASTSQLLKESVDRETRALVLVCHYPAEIPPDHQHHDIWEHRLNHGSKLLDCFRAVSIPVYWLHGHIHYPWRYNSPSVPNLTYLNPGPPLRQRHGVISLGRYVLEWDGSEMTKIEYRSLDAAV